MTRVLDKDGCTVKEVGFLKKIDETTPIPKRFSGITKSPLSGGIHYAKCRGTRESRSKAQRSDHMAWKIAREAARARNIRWAIETSQPFKSSWVNGIYSIQSTMNTRSRRMPTKQKCRWACLNRFNHGIHRPDFCCITIQTVKTTVKAWMEKKFINWWHNTAGLMQVKECINESVQMWWTSKNKIANTGF